MTYKIETATDGNINVTAPYNAKFVERAHGLNGRWDAARGVWMFSAIARPHVVTAIREVYGVDLDAAAPATMVCLRLEALTNDSAKRAAVALGPLQLARAYDRDSGARVGARVMLVEGRIRSGGSRANWATVIEQGAVFETEDLAEGEAALVIEAASKMVNYGDRRDDGSYGPAWRVTLIGAEEAPAETTPEPTPLEAALARVAELEAELAAANARIAKLEEEAAENANEISQLDHELFEQNSLLEIKDARIAELKTELAAASALRHELAGDRAARAEDSEEEEEEGGEAAVDAQPVYATWTVKELRALCKARGWRGYSRMTKAGLVQLAHVRNV